jgi:hypothetical protein
LFLATSIAASVKGQSEWKEDEGMKRAILWKLYLMLMCNDYNLTTVPVWRSVT